MGAGPKEGLAALLREHWRRQLGEQDDKPPAGREAEVSKCRPAKKPHRVPGLKSMT